MASILSIAVLTAVLGPAIGNVFAQAQLAAGCTTNSFTAPSWLVENFESQTSGGAVVASFQALNRATKTSLELRCQTSLANATAGWQRCSPRNSTSSGVTLVASFQADYSTAWFMFNETWSCSDLSPTKPITFTAVSNSSVPLDCTTQSQTTTCKSIKPLLMKATLLSPVKITPAYVTGPPGHDTEGCTAQSRTPAWEVVATQMNFGRTTSAFVIVRNDGLGYSATCAGALSADLEGPQLLTCQGQTAYRRPAKYQIGTTLSFNPRTFGLTVNQTWFCDDQDPAQPVSITASGTTILPLECQHFVLPDENTTFCTGGSNGTFSGNITSRALLQPYSLNDPLSTADSCTIASVVSPAWWLNNFETETTTSNSQVVRAQFDMELQTGGPGRQPTGNGGTLVADGVHVSNVSTNSSSELPWDKCELYAVGDTALAPTGCEMRYDMASRFLGLKVDWRCADLDPGSPVTFSGEVRTQVPEYTCVTSGTNIRCASPDPKPWRANVTSVTWR
ncbi:hypothetical protein N657DRAFT_622752 [Parathielavia appendiculata]|uniref:Uncharacterized protein n=1 Tax=Parathielavia appendiculata TaxID=2587402 RepID=A0AAN6TVJ5_9PEZI|nr:hypothetical protein N657DRAFT_622752 [Parathielavia appendiculata]